MASPDKKYLGIQNFWFYYSWSSHEMLILEASHNHLIVRHLPKKQEMAILNLSHIRGFEPQLWRAVLTTGWQSAAVEDGQQCWSIPRLKMGRVEKFERENLTLQSNGWDKVVQRSVPMCPTRFSPSFLLCAPPTLPQKQRLLPCASSKSLVSSYFCCDPPSMSLRRVPPHHWLSAGTDANVDEGIWLQRQPVLLEGPLCLRRGIGDRPENLFCRLD